MESRRKTSWNNQEGESHRKTARKNQAVENRKKSRARKSRGNLWMICLLTVTAAFAVAATAVLYVRNNSDQVPVMATVDISPDENAVSGVLNAEDGEPVAEGDYWIVLNQLPTMEAGSRDCNIQFENPRQNHYSARLSLYLKSTGERIGGTGRVDTGMYVETIQLSQILDPGEYPVQAVIELFSGTEAAGEMMLEITLRKSQSE